MSSHRNPGRVPGFWCLLLVVVWQLRLMYIPSRLFVPENATATADNIAIINHCRRDSLGCMAFSAGDPRVQVALLAAISGCVACHQRLRLRDRELLRGCCYRDTRERCF